MSSLKLYTEVEVLALRKELADERRKSDHWRKVYEKDWDRANKAEAFIRSVAEHLGCLSSRDDGGDWDVTDDDIGDHIDDTGCMKCSAALFLDQAEKERMTT